MIQAVMTKPGKIEYCEVAIPSVGENQIKVKIKRIGICGSDIHVYHGKHPYTSYPVVQGHEICGEVCEVGNKVIDFELGNLVTIQPQLVCGKCYPCNHGMYNACEELKVMGFQTTGMASEYFVVDSEKAIKLPSEMNVDHGAMIEPLAVAVHAVRRFGDVLGKKVLVLGGGPIGNLVAQTCMAMGASKVLLSEISTKRQEIAKKCRINTIDPNKEDLLIALKESFGEDRADVIFECVGINQTMKQAIDYARKGSDIIVVGVFADYGNINMGFVQDHELRLIGSAMYRTEDFIKAIELALTQIELNALITNRMSFQNYNEAYQLIDEEKDGVMKVIIELND